MFSKRQPGGSIFVFRTHCENDAQGAKSQRHALNIKKRLADRIALAEDDTGKPVIAYDAAPERIVEIEHQAFAALADRGGQQSGDMIGI